MSETLNKIRIEFGFIGRNIAKAPNVNATKKKFKSLLNPVTSGAMYPLTPRFLITEKAIINVDKVDNINGAPKIAPTLISSLICRSGVPAIIAKTGTVVSGSAVEIAANIEPVTPVEMFILSPKYSSAFENNCADIRIRTSITNSSNHMYIDIPNNYN